MYSFPCFSSYLFCFIFFLKRILPLPFLVVRWRWVGKLINFQNVIRKKFPISIRRWSSFLYLPSFRFNYFPIIFWVVLKRVQVVLSSELVKGERTWEWCNKSSESKIVTGSPYLIFIKTSIWVNDILEPRSINCVHRNVLVTPIVYGKLQLPPSLLYCRYFTVYHLRIVYSQRSDRRRDGST